MVAQEAQEAAAVAAAAAEASAYAAAAVDALEHVLGALQDAVALEQVAEVDERVRVLRVQFAGLAVRRLGAGLVAADLLASRAGRGARPGSRSRSA